jgi:hypothetical protein
VFLGLVLALEFAFFGFFAFGFGFGGCFFLGMRPKPKTHVFFGGKTSAWKQHFQLIFSNPRMVLNGLTRYKSAKTMTNALQTNSSKSTIRTDYITKSITI